MKQILQNLKTGQIQVQQVPDPVVKKGHLLIRTRCSLISSGTERMLVSFAKSGLLSKARQQPEKVKQVIEKIRTDGLSSTLHSVAARLDEPLPLGYCNCGTIMRVGEGVQGFSAGDRVVSNGPHAELVCVPQHLCAKVPETVTDEQAVFTVMAAIGLQGIRLMQPTFGETICVIGLGLIGLLSVQLLRANCCKVIAVDVNNDRLNLAHQYGARIINNASEPDLIHAAHAFTNGHGVDAVLITASAKNDDLVHQAAHMCRKRGRIVLVGVVNLHLDRADFYEKELSFQVSCSYGPGRYDERYEQKGQDYPLGFVRWTEQRNFQAILESFDQNHLNIENLISERLPQAEAQQAYHTLMHDQSKLALILTYPNGSLKKEKTVKTNLQSTKTTADRKVTVGLIGAGTFAKITLLPALKGLDIRRAGIADVNGVAGRHAAQKFGFKYATNDYHELLNDKDINAIFIATRHDTHAQLVMDALKAGKHVAVEKPLCLNAAELESIKQTYLKTSDQMLLVGFNRRFSPYSKKIRDLVAGRREPLCMVILVNAGKIPAQSWIQQKNIGGGRIIGEGCHWIDLMRYWAGYPIMSVSATMIGKAMENDVTDDKMSISLGFADGSMGTLHYFANGHKSFPKEKCTVFCEGKILELENFRRLSGYGWGKFTKMHSFKQDKGHRQEFFRFIEQVRRGGDSPIAFDEIEYVTLASFAAMQSACGAGIINLQ